ALIAAAAQGSPPPEAPSDPRTRYAEWLQGQPEATKDQWLIQWMTDPRSIVRREILAEFHKSRRALLWPTVRRGRPIAELTVTANEIQAKSNRKAAEKAARKRTKKLADMAADPNPTLRKTEQLVKQRSTEAYREIATLLAELRQALAGSDQS